MTDPLSYVIVAPRSTEEAAVVRIQEQYKEFFFVPFAQLEQAISDGCILAACDGATVIGYVWFVVRDKVVRIRYLAVDRSHTKRGIGRCLVRELKRRVPDAYGMRLSCRTDYPGWNFWKRLGFRVIRNRPGRAKAGSTLTDFYYELCPLPLFAREAEGGGRAIAAIDANVFFDLADKSRPHHVESAGLLADWLSAEVELCVTAAIHEDIKRSAACGDTLERLENWREIRADPAAFRCIHEQLLSVVGSGETPQDASDRNHLAHAIAENLTGFITRDEDLLKYSELIYEQFGISLQRPSEFIGNIDVVLNQSQYDWHDIISVRMSLGRIRSLEDLSNLDVFLRANDRERVLRGRIRAWLSHPGEFEVRAITSNGEPLVVYVVNPGGRGVVVDVPLLRCSRRITAKRRGRTLSRFLASILRQHSSRAHVIKISDNAGLEDHASALLEAGFTQTASGYYKLCMPGIWTAADAANEIERIACEESLPHELADRLGEQLQALGDCESFLRLEHAIWPGKLMSGDVVPCAVIPIRPRWARALFDWNLGQAEFWDEDADLLLNPSSVYYSGSRLAIQKGRVLWYVSHDNSFTGTKAVRACSQLTGRVLARPLDLYRRFRHLGVYTLGDVQAIASAARPEVLAMEFCNTELFKQPVKLSAVRQTLRDESLAFQWPISIPEAGFFDIYQRGHI